MTCRQQINNVTASLDIGVFINYTHFHLKLLNTIIKSFIGNQRLSIKQQQQMVRLYYCLIMSDIYSEFTYNEL
jgi:hypothetical protein